MFPAKMGSLKTIQNSNSRTTSQDQRSHCESKIFYTKFLRIKVLTDLSACSLLNYPAQSWKRFSTPTNFHDLIPYPLSQSESHSLRGRAGGALDVLPPFVPLCIPSPFRPSVDAEMVSSRCCRMRARCSFGISPPQGMPVNHKQRA